jgi:hypothetical protein
LLRNDSVHNAILLTHGFNLPYVHDFVPLDLQLNSSLGRLLETFRFTSVTRSRTVGMTPWMGDQLVAVHKHRKTHTTLLIFITVSVDKR